jgi:hypothetical protein
VTLVWQRDEEVMERNSKEDADFIVGQSGKRESDGERSEVER